MEKIVLCLPKRVKMQLRQWRRSTRDAGLATRCQIILHADKGRSSRAIAEAIGCSRSWASRVIRRFQQLGPPGLLDGRADNGEAKLTEEFLGLLQEVVAGSPQDYGQRRPTWTRELLVKVMLTLTGTVIHVATMSRALKTIGARRGRPRPVVRCPWSKRAKHRRIREIRRVLDTLADDEVAVYQDEVDIHLNPKIGLDWMNRGQQKEVVTPGQNQKRYLAGALDARTGQLTAVEGERKNSALFVSLLKALEKAYPRARRIHVILDNYRIHSSRIVQLSMQTLSGRLVLHFLPPYCPEENRIERLWQDLHAEVTRNHSYATIEELMAHVRQFVKDRSKRHVRHEQRRVA